MRNILVTRPNAQSVDIIAALSKSGDNPIALPLLNIEPIDIDSEKDEIDHISQCLATIARVDCLIFISTNAVDCFFYWLKEMQKTLSKETTCLAIGSATQQRLLECGVVAECSIDAASNSEALLQLPVLKNVKGLQLVIVRGQGGREHLKPELEKCGAQVDYLEVYKRSRINYSLETLSNILQYKLNFILLTSGETIQQLLHQAMMESISNEVLLTPIIVPGKRLHKFATDQGFTQVLQAENASVQAILQVINGTG